MIFDKRYSRWVSTDVLEVGTEEEVFFDKRTNRITTLPPITKVLEYNNTSGNLSATDLVSAVDELSSRFEYNNTSGNLSATDLVSAVDELSSRMQSFILACGDETSDLSVGTSKASFRMPFPFTVVEVRASATGEPTGSALTANINEEGESILSTVISIDAGAKTSTTATTQPIISDASIADDAEITVDIVTVGSTTPGKGLKVTLIGYAT